MSFATLLYGSDLHYLDHIAPLSSLIQAPLFFTNDELYTLAKTYYPDLACKLFSPLNISHLLLKNFDCILSCLPRQLLDPLFFFDERLLRKKLLSIWLPHGNSDKDHLEALTEETIVLVYGRQMQEILANKKILKNLFRCIVVGNYRKQFYAMHKAFYDTLIGEKITFQNRQTTLLYAPTWQKNETVDQHLKVLENLPSHYNMLVKLHPNSTSKAFYPQLKERFYRQKNIRFVDDIPTIYPILDKADIYIGDHSSIAYDFLSFNRPLFFLSKNTTLIHQAGHQITLDHLYQTIEENDSFLERRNAIYAYAFDETIQANSLFGIIKKTIQDYFDSEIHLL